VAPQYDCKNPIEGTLHIVVKSSRGLRLESEIELSDLVWPKTSEGCLPVGYVQAKDSNLPRPLSFSINGADNTFEFEFTLRSEPRRIENVHVWVVYSNRAPIERMLPERFK
jgi:hypothetical protein